MNANSYTQGIKRIMIKYYSWVLKTGQLPNYSLAFFDNLAESCYGMTDFDDKIILIDAPRHKFEPVKIATTILHELAHASTGLVNHNKKWYNEYRRLSRKYNWRKYKG